MSSFKLTRQSILNMESMQDVNIEVLFDAMQCLLKDIYEYNKVDGIVDIPLGDKTESEVLKKELGLLMAFSTLYDANKKGMDELGDFHKEKYKEIIPQIEEAKKDIGKKSKEYDDLLVKKKELENQLIPLREKQAEIDKLEASNTAYEKEITRLSDLNLDSIRTKNEQLKVNAESRQKIEEKLLKEQNEAQKKINDISNNVNSLKDDIKRLEDDIEKIEREKTKKETERTNNEKNKAEIQKDIEKIEKQIKDIKNWIEESGNNIKKLETDYTEIKSKFSIFSNMCSAMLNEDFLKENLYGINGETAALADVNFPDLDVVSGKITDMDSFEKWIKDLDERIQKLVNIYGKVVLEIRKQVEQLKQQED